MPSGEREYPKAPPVTDPLDAAKYVEDPCASLTEAQRQEFNTDSHRENSDQNGTSCIWNINRGSTSVGVSYLTSVDTGLSNLYALNEVEPWAYFEPTEVSGYPAVYQSLSDHRADGSCGLAVGIRDDLFFTADVTSQAGNDSCKAAENVAAAVIETIKAGA